MIEWFNMEIQLAVLKKFFIIITDKRALVAGLTGFEEQTYLCECGSEKAV